MKRFFTVSIVIVLILFCLSCDLFPEDDEDYVPTQTSSSNVKTYTANGLTFALKTSKLLASSSSSSSLTSFITNTYGSGYRIADWNDLKTLSSSQITSLMSSLGMTYEDANMVTRSSSRYYSSSRHYFVSRHDGNCPSYFLDHDDLYSHKMSLGSWEGSYPVLVVKGSSSSSGNSQTGTGTVSGTVVDATTGNGISGVSVSTGSTSTTTGSTGSFTLTLSSGTYTLSFTKTGYNFESYSVAVSAGSTTNIPSSTLIGNPQISGSSTLRIVLTWGSSPSDLDSHLKTPDGKHIYFSQKRITGCSASLDVDDTTSYGPETITNDPVSSSGTYKYYVYNYSGSPDIKTSGATVKVYNASGLYRTYTVPSSGSGRYWNVFELNSGSIITKNTIQSSEP